MLEVCKIFVKLNEILTLSSTRCSPGLPCERCRNTRADDQCLEPDCNDPANRGMLFPSPVLRYYYQCMPNGGTWTAKRIECPCDLIFNAATQRCEFPWLFVPTCDFSISDPT